MAGLRSPQYALFLLASILELSAALLDQDQPLLLNVTGGRVRGVVQGTYRIFRGMPYAAPPLRDLRWRPPQPHPGWSGVLNATEFGPSCLTKYSWPSINFSQRSEDCLTINVVTPRRQGRFPVMVFFHAGEFILGTSNDAEMSFPYFADDIILVTPNSRLSAFGYIADDALRSRDPMGGTGNYGVLDQRFALEWVQSNIAAFGGDASNVAIAGESSGATCVMFHLTAGAMSDKLFQKAILESPGITQVKSWEDATMNTEYIVSALTAFSSANCPRSTGYAMFNDTLVAPRPGSMKHVTDNHTVASAMQWCDRNSTCKGFMWEPEKKLTTFVGIGKNQSWYIGREAGATVFLQRGPVDAKARTRCLVSSDADQITELSIKSLPREDTVFVDHWGPVIDGIYLNETLVSKVARGALVDGVHVLAGSNLDEGTEFMMYAPPIKCNATSSDLEAWATTFYGPEVSAAAPALYAQLQRPLPQCQQGFGTVAVSGEAALPYMTAMRSAGEVAFRCPTRSLARVATGRSYIYQFTITPQYSENMDQLNVNGAFHGAEVPFVFGFGLELKTDLERNLSKAMGCYWRNFLWHGDPSYLGDECGATVWPKFTDRGSPQLVLGPQILVQKTDSQLEARCELFNTWLQHGGGEGDIAASGEPSSNSRDPSGGVRHSELFV